MWEKPKIISEQLAINLSSKFNNKKIGITTGCFDIFHSGHLKSIKFSKKNCDILFLLLNSDESIKKLKGENRPINNLNFRLDLLKELPYIDYIVIFNEKDADSLLEKMTFDTLFKGGDYDLDKLKEKFPNIKIMLSEYIKEENGKASSTSNIIQKLTDTLHLDV
jgi:D-beta-D-heptose 7-phosphate kinase/D-beta-D-heptose 1-phosphate adenosyltransferase